MAFKLGLEGGEGVVNQWSERIFFFPGRKYSTVKDKSKESIGHAWGERKEKLGEYRRMMMEKCGKNETDPNISSLEAWDQTLR